jgi:class 3 adenylate cyclase
MHLQADTRLGVTVAEVARDVDEVTGYGVQVAAQLADSAPPGTVWVSATVGFLLSGSSVVLESAGPVNDGEAVLRAVSA